MKRIFSLALAALLLAGCTPDVPAENDTSAAADTADITTPAVTTAPAETEPAYDETTLAGMSAFTVDCGDFSLEFEAPTVVYYGKETDTEWGQHTFPGLTRMSDGTIRISWHYGEDRVGGSATWFQKATPNGGKSWVPAAGNTQKEMSLLMADGDCFAGFVSAGTTTKFSTSKYTPAVTWGSYKRFFAADFAGDEQAENYNIISLKSSIYDAETRTVSTVDSTLNWPWAPVTVHPGNITYTVSGVFGLSGANIIATDDGSLYTVLYCGGFDSDAKTREEAIANIDDPSKSNVYVFESTDSGRTWNYISQILSTAERRAKSVEFAGTTNADEGYSEPRMIEMPDGSFFMLLRTGSARTMFWSRSTDRGRTWSEPEVFDHCGVLPALLQLDCGVTIASYGRPCLYLRGTTDPTGLTWADHVEIPLCSSDLPIDGTKYMQKSCFYTGMAALDENSFLLSFTDFQYPNKDGVPVHTVLTRRVHVIMNE